MIKSLGGVAKTMTTRASAGSPIDFVADYEAVRAAEGNRGAL